MSNNGPDDEVSFGIELSEKGVTGKAKGRTLAIVQRWFGSALAPSIARNERLAARERTLAALEKEAFKQIAPEALRQIANNPDAIDAVIQAAAPPGTFRREENVGAVFDKAIEDLRHNPPTDEQRVSGAPEITPEVADRLQHYASGATTDEVRERWGRVLAAEIRTPGTFSLKVLRIIDELDNDLPVVFETFAANRFGADSIPRCLSGKLGYTSQIELIDAGLLHDQGGKDSYQVQYFVEGQVYGKDAWLYPTDLALITIPREGTYANTVRSGESPVVAMDGKPALPCYLLTSAGVAISSILPPIDVSLAYLTALRVTTPDARLLKRSSKEGNWQEVNHPSADKLPLINDPIDQ